MPMDTRVEIVKAIGELSFKLGVSKLRNELAKEVLKRSKNGKKGTLGFEDIANISEKVRAIKYREGIERGTL